MHWAHPYVLGLLAIVPPLGATLVWFSWHRKQKGMSKFGDKKLWSRFSEPLAKKRFYRQINFTILALICSVLALAQPTLDNGRLEFVKGTIDEIAIIDTSYSMARQDYDHALRRAYTRLSLIYSGESTRLDMARFLLEHSNLPAIKANQLGYITFAGQAFSQAFITDDFPALNWITKHAITISSNRSKGSNLPAAFELAFEFFALDSIPKHHKMIILFSDGGNDAGQGKLAAVCKKCHELSIKVIVVGLGKNSKGPIPIDKLPVNVQKDFNPSQWFTINGQVVNDTAIDAQTLHFIAAATGGKYVHVKEASDFQLGSLASDHTEMTYVAGEEDVSIYPIALSAVFMALASISLLEPKRR